VRLIDGFDFFFGLTATGSAHWMLVWRWELSLRVESADDVEPDLGVRGEEVSEVGETTTLGTSMNLVPNAILEEAQSDGEG
jgi:hypothetical protein